MTQAPPSTPAADNNATAKLIGHLEAIAGHLKMTIGASGPIPDRLTMAFDVQSCLLNAMTTCFPIRPGDIENDTTPDGDEIGADRQGWSICLHVYAAKIVALRPAYSGYRHRERYTDDTLSKGFSDIVDYLTKELASQVPGA